MVAAGPSETSSGEAWAAGLDEETAVGLLSALLDILNL
jgi:hypothetical protein